MVYVVMTTTLQPYISHLIHYLCTHACMCPTIHLPTCTLMHMHTHVYIHAHMYICTLTHTQNVHEHMISLNYLSMDTIAPHTSGVIVSDRLNKHILLIISKCIHIFHYYINVTMIVIHNQP